MRVNKDINHSVFENHEDADAAYVAGLLYGDGCLYHMLGSHSFRVQLEMGDLDAIKFVSSKLGKTQIQRCKRGKGSFILSVVSKKMFDDLAFYNVVPRKTYVNGFRFPHISLECAWSFIRGIYDSDGTLCGGNSPAQAVWLVGTSMDFAIEICRFLGNQGVDCFYYVRNRVNKMPLHLVIIRRKKSIQEFFKQIYTPGAFKIKRKSDLVKSRLARINLEVLV